MSPFAVSITMGALFVLIVAWDIYLAVDSRKNNTISARLKEWNERLGFVKMVMSFAFGVLCGHWFWPM